MSISISIRLFAILLLSLTLAGGCTSLTSPQEELEGLEVYEPVFYSERSTQDGTPELKWGWLQLGGSQQPMGRPASRYFLYMGINDSTSLDLLAELPANQFSYLLSELEMGQTYYFRIEAWISAENTRFSDVISLTPGPLERKEALALNENLSASHGSWSPDAAFIAMQVKKENETAIGIANWQQGTYQEVGRGQDPSWNPATNDIAFQSLVDTSTGYFQNALQVIDPSNAFVLESTFGGDAHYIQASWGHGLSGKNYIAYVSDQAGREDWALYIYNPVDGRDPKKLVQASRDKSFRQLPSIGRPTWSKSGPSQIAYEAFVSKPSGADSAYWVRDIQWISPVDGSEGTLLSSQWDDYAPAFSSCGSYLAFLSNRSGKTEIWAMEMASRKLIQLTGNTRFPPAAEVNKIEWSADARYLLYTYKKEDGSLGLARLKLEIC